MNTFLILIYGTAVVVLWITLQLAWREHRDRRLGARRGYSWNASYNDRTQAERAAQHDTEAVRKAGWLL